MVPEAETAGHIGVYVNNQIDVLENSKAPINHTHSYAGSSSVGGAATSVNKLNTNAGNATSPVYFENGVPNSNSSDSEENTENIDVLSDEEIDEEIENEIIEEPFIFDWDGLAYPRAFEDIYDPIWRD